MKNFKKGMSYNRNKFINSDTAKVLMDSGFGSLLQVGQWIKWDNGKCSRVVRKNLDGGPVQFHPNRGIGTVEQRFRRAHALAGNGWLSIHEPQATALAVSKCDDLEKLRANASIVSARIAQIKAGV